MSRPSLEDRVLAELLAIRKSREGVTVAVLARSPVVCALLGEGDPDVAYTSLMHRVLDSELDLSIQATAASLGE